jgi:cytochrome c-type biogenesis protein CcmH/NrfG
MFPSREAQASPRSSFVSHRCPARLGAVSPGKSTVRRRAAEHAREADALLQSSWLRKIGIALICAFVALVPLVFDPRADASFAVPKALLSHALAYALAGVLAGLLITFGRDALRWSWLHVPVLGFLVVNSVATLVAEDRILALYGTHTRMLGLGSIAAWTLLYLAIVVLVRSRADAVAIVVAGLGAAAVMLGYEAVQLFGVDPFLWSIDSQIRPFSTNGQATTLAAYLTTLSVASFACAVAGNALPRWTRAVLLCFAGVLLVGAAATGTRSALVGLASGSAVLVGLVWLRHPSRRARAISLATAAIGAVALSGLLTLTPVGARILQTGSSAGDPDQLAQLDFASLDVRAVLYRVAVDVVMERPVLGYGPDNFVVGMTQHRPESGVDEARLAHATSPHSWVAQVATGSGLIGLATFLGIIVTALVLVVRTAFGAVTVSSATALAAHLGTGLTSVNDVGSDWLLWVAFGLVAVASWTDATTIGHDTRSLAPRGKRGGRRVRVTPATAVLAGVCVAVGAAFAVTTPIAFDASRSAWRSEESRLGGRIGEAIDAGLLATSKDPGRAEYWKRLGLAYVAGARWRDAAKSFERAVALAPWDVRYNSDLVQTELALASSGDAAARTRALQLVDDAVRREPNYPAAHYTRAVVMQFVGNVPEGLRSIERALTLNPQTRNVSWYVVATQLNVASGRPAEGVRVARLGIVVFGSLQLRIELARALLANGQPQEALTEVDIVLAADARNSAAQRLRADILGALPK